MSGANRIAGQGRVDAGQPHGALHLRRRAHIDALRKATRVASALLANGVHLVGRSFKYHRPRGILAAGPDEPNALDGCFARRRGARHAERARDPGAS
jgi:sarcosine oxidase subunit alpha